MNNTYQQLNQNLQSEVAANQVQIKQLENRLQVTMVNAILFPEGPNLVIKLWIIHIDTSSGKVLSAP